MRKRSSKRKGLPIEVKLAIIGLIIDLIFGLIDLLKDC